MSSLKSSTTRKRVKINIPSQLDYEKIPIAAVGIVAQQMGFPPERVETLKTAMGEAVTNAIEHGNQQNAATRVSIEIVVEPAVLMMCVIDQGLKAFVDIPNKRVERPDNRGWGWQWINDFTDEVIVEAKPGRNEVQMIVYLNKVAK
jgi:serine/threonine-protein kinase RsbW